MTKLKRLNRKVVEDTKFIPAAVGFFRRENQVLLGLRTKVSNDLGLNLYAGIGGKVGDRPEWKDETVVEGFIRECQQEVGITPTTYHSVGRVRFVCPEKPKWQQDVTVFVVDAWDEEPHVTNTANPEIVPEWFNVNALPKKQMWQDNLIWVPRIIIGEKVDIVFLLDSDCNVLDQLDLDKKN